MPEEPAPTEAATFAELLDGAGPTAAACRRCGETATHRVQLGVRVRRSEGESGPGTLKQVAYHGADMCEAHAVQLFAQVRKVMR